MNWRPSRGPVGHRSILRRGEVSTDNGVPEQPLPTGPLAFKRRRMADCESEAEELCKEIAGR